MADFVYDKSNYTLTGHGRTWAVRSGIPGKHVSIPNGLYICPAGSLMAATPGKGVPHDPKYGKKPYAYRDSNGLSWFLWLGKGKLGIHPDGNVPGTKGCIGVVDGSTLALFNKLKSLNGRKVTVHVKGDFRVCANRY
jgi:hypothetical protein